MPTKIGTFQFLPTGLHGLCVGFCFAGPLPLRSLLHGPLSRVHFGESLVVRLYSGIDHIHLSSEAQCVSHHLPLVDCHTCHGKLENLRHTCGKQKTLYENRVRVVTWNLFWKAAENQKPSERQRKVLWYTGPQVVGRFVGYSSVDVFINTYYSLSKFSGEIPLVKALF